MMEILRSSLRSLGFGQRRCANCLREFFPDSPEEKKLCPACASSLAPWRGPVCRFCGLPLPANGNCPACRAKKPPWQAFAFHGLYEGSLRDLLLRFKFEQELHIESLLAAFLLEACVCLPGPDAIIPIPQEKGRLRARGYNQAHQIAKALAAASGLRLYTALERSRPGPPQENLNASARKANLAGAFRASKKVAGMSAWVIDDVMTTGSTLSEACATLLGAGASHVSILFVARTPFSTP